MFSMVKFNNNEFDVIQTKKIRMVGAVDCLVKYKGTTYAATLINSNDSQEELEKLKLKLLYQSSIKNIKQLCVRLERSSLLPITAHCSTPVNTVSLYRHNFNIDLISESVASRYNYSNEENDVCQVASNHSELHLNNSDTRDSTYNPDLTVNISSNSQIDYLRNSQVDSLNNISKESTDYSSAGPALDIRKLNVPCSRIGNKRSIKRDFCMYCKTLQTKLARHLQLKHRDEEQVQEFLCISKKLLQRNKLIEKIRNEGNLLHNTNPKYNTGILITVRQITKNSKNTAEDYLVCKVCKGTFSKRTFRIHFKKCQKDKKNARGISISSRRITGYIHPRANDVLRRLVFPVLNDDQMTRIIRYDELIIIMGNKFCDRYTLPHQHDLIRAQLRLLGRFKQVIMKRNQEICEFSQVFNPKYYDLTIDCVRECAGYNSENQVFRAPTTAFNLGTLLKKSAKAWIAECIKIQDDQRKLLTETFLILFEDDFPTTINMKSKQDREITHHAKQVTLPLKSDIKILYDYLKDNGKKAFNMLQRSFNLAAWKKLSEISLILIQMFNRRRAGEIERLLISDFHNQEAIDGKMDPDLYNKLSAKSREIAKNYVRITIRGKLGRTVPVLFDAVLLQWIKMLLRYRVCAGIPSSNKYVFAIPTTNKLAKPYLRACPLMRKFSEASNAVMPSTLRGTTLRKHIATYTAMLGIEENQVSDLANFMGHNKQIHKDIYRVPGALKDIADISQLLQAAIGVDEIQTVNVNDNRNVFQANISCEIQEHNEILDIDSISITSLNKENECRTKKRRSTSPYGKTKRTKWTVEEKDAVTAAFGDPTKIKSLPSLKRCQETINKFVVLQQRSAKQLKTWLSNQQLRQSRIQQKFEK